MPYYGVARVGDRVITGHGCDTTTSIASGSQTVFVDGQSVARQTDNLTLHNLPGSGTDCVPHIGAEVLGGQLDVLVEGLPIARVFTEADSPGGRVSSGSESVAVYSPV